ncbi:MAG: cytochrome c oxidase subunit II [Rhodocyclaceae bacterium]|nr:cytochrome c oxidase subunit II [Rhodocyclaceae bacterium]MBX3671058.1 cytochrome c oxidase subunit II [Rhodocyclaceae bacterium]
MAQTGKPLPLLAAALALGPGVAQAAYKFNMQEPATALGEQVYFLHNMMTAVCGVIFVAVFAVMFYSVFVHRKSLGAKAANFHENMLVEVLWTVVPVFILLAIAWPVTKTVLGMRDTSNPDITIKATGYQWKWGYDYLKGEGEGIHFVSNLSTPQDQIHGKAEKGEHYLLEVDNPLVVPVGKKIRILTTAADVIHAWFVPALAVKQDAVPGFIRDTHFRADKEGVFRGQCAELCGKDHGFMPIEVHVLSAEKYAAWVGEQKKKMAALADDPNKTWNLGELKKRGEQVYASNCAACHQPTGKGNPPAFPALAGSKVVLGPKQAQIETELNGRPGTAMAAFKHLSDVELAAVITYTRNAFGNATGEAIQPSEIKAARK